MLQEKVMMNKEHPFDSWNDLQPFYLGKLGRYLPEIFSSRTLLAKLPKITHIPTQNVMRKVHDLYCLTRIINDIGIFRENDYITSDQFKMIRTKALLLSKELTPHSIRLTDALGPEEFLIQSELARNDGKVFQNFLDKVYEAKNCFGPAEWGSSGFKGRD